uniref:Uncharacterized protein n=1 Tax=Phenylobacterium glaciei TaxID=2803784 RepID=A0A974P312_9CAUL|nr:hypothetical protein JKL49_25580 [Phenylobacterium glaciei]
MIGSIGLKGMEVALWSLCFAVLLTVAAWAAPEPRRGVWIGLAAAVCIGARIDSAFFVVPLVVALPTGRPARASAFAVLSVLGLAYALYNLKTFGVAMPISSSIKSLGGLQINHPMLAQLSPFDPRQHARFYGLTLLALLASPLLVALSRPGTIGRALAIASTLGGALYLAKLLFLSSWILWPWYNFAILLPMAAGLLILPPYMDAAAIRLSSHVTRAGLERAGLALAIGGLGLLALGSIAAYLKPFRHDNDFAASSHQAVQLYGGLLKGARVAMGTGPARSPQSTRDPSPSWRGWSVTRPISRFCWVKPTLGLCCAAAASATSSAMSTISESSAAGHRPVAAEPDAISRCAPDRLAPGRGRPLALSQAFDGDAAPA